jgi:hypothetical protein
MEVDEAESHDEVRGRLGSVRTVHDVTTVQGPLVVVKPRLRALAFEPSLTGQ